MPNVEKTQTKLINSLKKRGVFINVFPALRWLLRKVWPAAAAKLDML